MPIFYDTHAHLDYPDFQSDFAQILERSQAAGITKLISIGTDLESSARAIKLAEEARAKTQDKQEVASVEAELATLAAQLAAIRKLRQKK